MTATKAGAFRPQLDILPASQQQLWNLLRSTPRLGFVLYGGTAIALRLGHRVSVDFDFFTDRPLDRERLRTSFDFMAASTVLQDQPDTLTISVPPKNAGHHSVKVSFFGSIGFGRVASPDVTDDGILQVASLDDLMATKLKVILQRVEAKDYRDIAAMLAAGVSLPAGLAAARLLFGTAFQPSESLKAMTWFEGGDLDTLTKREQAILIDAASAVRDLPVVELASSQLAVP